MLRVLCAVATGAAALSVSPAGLAAPGRASCVRMSFAEDAGIPCLGECALNAYPKLPDSVHPGVVTGQALMDLLDDAKQKGYAIPAVNCVTSSSVNACLEAARKADAPIIIQFSSGGSQFYAGKGLDNSGFKAAIAGAVSREGASGTRLVSPRVSSSSFSVALASMVQMP